VLRPILYLFLLLYLGSRDHIMVPFSTRPPRYVISAVCEFFWT